MFMYRFCRFNKPSRSTISTYKCIVRLVHRRQDAEKARGLCVPIGRVGSSALIQVGATAWDRAMVRVKAYELRNKTSKDQSGADFMCY